MTPAPHDAASLRAAQAPFKELYREDPAQAIVPVSASASFAEPGITVTVPTWSEPVRAGLHHKAGGDPADACSGDMLLEALLGCVGVTLRSVLTAMSIDVRAATLTATGQFDMRGTLGVSRDVPVGVTDIEVVAELETDADDETLAKVGKLVDRYCVVSRSLAEPARIIVRRA